MSVRYLQLYRQPAAWRALWPRSLHGILANAVSHAFNSGDKAVIEFVCIA